MLACYLNDIETNLEFIETSDVVWEEAVVDAAAQVIFKKFFKYAKLQLKHFVKANMGTLLTFYLKKCPNGGYQGRKNVRWGTAGIALRTMKEMKSHLYGLLIES